MTTTEHDYIADDLRSLAFPVASLKLLPGNPRRGDVDAVARSYERFGQRKPIVARRSDMTVIAGNHQLQAAQRLGWTHVAVVWTDDDDLTAKAYALADNRTADLGSYDDASLAALLADVSIDPSLFVATGYSLDDLLRDAATTSTHDESDSAAAETDEVPSRAPAKTIRGDVWLLGPHRLMCGDSREPTDVDKLLDGQTIHLAVTSPPYAEQRTYDETSGFKPIHPDEYVDWFEMVQANVAAHLAEDGSWFVNIKAAADGLDRSLYVMDLVTAHVRRWGWHFADEFCWERNGVPKQPVLRLKNQWEPVYQFTRGRWKFRPENVMHPTNDAIIPWGPGRGNTSWADPNSAVVSQGQRGDLFAGQRARRVGRGNTSWKDRQGSASGAFPDYDDVKTGFAYPGNRLPSFAGTHEATGHTAAFPVGLPEFFVKLCTDEGENVYDPFMGSGSTLLAAHRQNRVGYGMEISPAYCDIICARFQRATGIVPVAESTGQAHSFIEET